MTTHVKSTDALEPLVGTHLGYSDYHTITQQQVNLFADATGDHQWIHIDPVRAAAGPVRALNRGALRRPDQSRSARWRPRPRRACGAARRRRP